MEAFFFELAFFEVVFGPRDAASFTTFFAEAFAVFLVDFFAAFARADAGRFASYALMNRVSVIR